MNENDILDKVPTGLFISGEFRPSSDGSTIDVEDPATGTVLTCTATPRVLPWVECPAAAASAARLAGLSVAGLRDHVRTTLIGTSTCTHLNDTLRSLEDVAALLPSGDPTEAPDRPT